MARDQAEGTLNLIAIRRYRIPLGEFGIAFYIAGTLADVTTVDEPNPENEQLFRSLCIADQNF